MPDPKDRVCIDDEHVVYECHLLILLARPCQAATLVYVKYAARLRNRCSARNLPTIKFLLASLLDQSAPASIPRHAAQTKESVCKRTPKTIHYLSNPTWRRDAG